LRQKFVFSALRGHITSIVRTQQTLDNGKTRLRNINVPSYPLNFGEAQAVHPGGSSALFFRAGYCNFAYSALASFRMGTSGSASFQRAPEVLIGVVAGLPFSIAGALKLLHLLPALHTDLELGNPTRKDGFSCNSSNSRRLTKS
jgi:hypothetical protein